MGDTIRVDSMEAKVEVEIDGQKRAADSPKIWATLITSSNYLPGLFVLHYSLKKVNSCYPLVALYTDSLPEDAQKAIDARGIAKSRVDRLLPDSEIEKYTEPRFLETWTKLSVFGLTEFERVVLLDSDMLVLQNMDELMDIELDAKELEGKGESVFAASHACTCNPMKKPHYPKSWIPENCAFTLQHPHPEEAQTTGAPATAGLGLLNSGLLVINPSCGISETILQTLKSPKVHSYEFPDQDLLADVYRGRWVALPYVYNALKTLRWDFVHAPIWRDERVKNIHYILGPKPWNEKEEGPWVDETHGWWWDANAERKRVEREAGIGDGL